MTMYAEPLLFDDALFDAEIEIERKRIPVFDRDGIAAAVGISIRTVPRWIKLGYIPEPDHYERTEVGDRFPVWTRMQAAQSLRDRRWRA
jgi:hypothetical protein